MFDSGRIPTAALEGLAEYSHCWILYVFHLNTDLDKLWREPSRSKFKAKVFILLIVCDCVMSPSILPVLLVG